MPTKVQGSENAYLAASWDNLLCSNKQEMKLEEMELSALSSLMHDCLKEFDDIKDLLRQISCQSFDDDSGVHDVVVDIYWKLAHIKNHIVDSDKGFDELMQVLASKE